MAYVKDYTAIVRQVTKVSDGDTYWMRLDPGFHQWVFQHVRLSGYDTPERASGSPYERAQGKLAMLAATEWFDLHLLDGTIWIRTARDPVSSFDRWIGEIWHEGKGETSNLGEELCAADLATRWPTRWHEVHDPRRDRKLGS